MSYLIDPRSPLCVPDLSGRLQDHEMVCDECHGTGHIDGETGYPPKEEQCAHCKEKDFPDCCTRCDPCSMCDNGKVWWWCWYAEDRGQCDTCREHDVLISSYDPDGWVCLPCYLKWHKDRCGCDLWKWAEDWILGST